MLTERRSPKPSTPSFHNRERNQGFTLLEIMVSISIIAIVFVAIYEMHFTTLSLTQRTQFSYTAPILAQHKLAQFEQSGFGNLTRTDGDFQDIHPGYRWKITVEDVDSKILGSVSKELKKVDLTIFQPGEKDVFSIRTYRFIR